MQKWQYHALQIRDNQLYQYDYQTRPMSLTPIPPDLFIEEDENNPSSTIRRWTAHLGLNGWELVGILIYEGNDQEWIFKRLLYQPPEI